MSDKTIVEGDFSQVKIQLAGGGTGAEVDRPGPGTQLVWGGTGPSTPWGHLVALIEKAGGTVNLTQIHAGDLMDSMNELPRPSGAPGEAPMQHGQPDGPSAEPEDEPEKEEEKPGIEQVKPKAAEGGATEQHHAGPPGKGPLFEKGIEFSYQGEEACVWAHPRAARAGPRPLVVFLHGISKSKHPPLGDLVGTRPKHVTGWTHVGKLAHKLIDDGKLTPLAIAAPSNVGKNPPWTKFDLASFVNMVEQKLREQGVEIDLDQVAVAGHSGAGGYQRCGLDKIFEDHATFSGHKLLAVGIEDTCINAGAAARYKKGLEGNDKTAVYSVHRHTGGWPDPTYSGAAKFAAALGADKENKTKVVGNEELADFDSYHDNGDARPARVSIKVKQMALPKYRGMWTDAGGYFGNEGPHGDMVPMWCWLALPRFLPPTEADKKLMASAKKDARPAPPPAPPKQPAGPPAIQGGEPNIPAPPPPWIAPGEVAPKAFAPSEFADATSAVFWPIRNAKVPWGRGVSYLGENGKGYGPAPGGCRWLAQRGGGRLHVGIDLAMGGLNSIVVACEAGTIVNFYPFLMKGNRGVYALFVQCDSGLVINYGEVDPNSLKEFNLKVGDRVTAGQTIARIGRCPGGDSMLHFETYPSGVKLNISNYAGLKGVGKYRNPTSYLLYLAKNGR